MQRSVKLRWLERGLVTAGILGAVCYVGLNVPAVIARARPQASQVSSDGPILPDSALGSAYLQRSGSFADGAKIGTISIPQLHLVAPVVEGIRDGDLRRGVGHVPGSAMSGGLGNMVLAAHRDTIFRPLRSIQKGMDIQVNGTDGTYHYRVDSLQVVSPDKLEVLAISDQPQVTLITCYPFNFIGSAPMRFIVKAHLISPIADTPAA